MKAKFKGFSKKLKDWVIGDLATVYIEGKMYIVHREDGDDEFSTRWTEVYPESVSPFIGKRALDGVELYMGDILQDETRKTVYKIAWLEEECCFALNNMHYPDIYISFLDVDVDSHGNLMLKYVTHEFMNAYLSGKKEAM